MVAGEPAKRYTLRDLERLFEWVRDEGRMVQVRIIDEGEEWPPPQPEDAASTARRLAGYQGMPLDARGGFKQWCHEQYLCLGGERGCAPGLYIDEQRIRREVAVNEASILLEHHLGDVDLPLLPDPFTRSEFIAFAATAHFMTAAAWGPSDRPARTARLAFLDEHMPRSADLARVLDGEQATEAPSRTDASQEVPGERARRRLARFEALGGGARRAGEGWQLGAGKRGALAQLISEELAADRPMRNKTDVREDLRRALEAREMAQRGEREGGTNG